MFATQITESINTASLTGCDEVARTLWRAYSSGALADPDVEALSTALEDRRAALRGRVAPEPGQTSKPPYAPASRFPPRRKQVSPDRARSRERRRTLAASGPMPPALAAKFTQGELAVLFIVVAEVREHGLCDRSYDELAARAGCSRTLARQAIRLAARYGLLSIELRPRPGRKNLTNIVRIIDATWRLWMDRGQKSTSHGHRLGKRGREDAEHPRLLYRPHGGHANGGKSGQSPGNAEVYRCRRGLGNAG